MMKNLVEKSRLQMGRNALPSYSLIDSQKVLRPQTKLKRKALMGEKKIKGRKRHIVTDTQGHLLHVKVHKANIHDTVSGCEVFEKATKKYPTLKGVCAMVIALQKMNTN